jgi:Ca-activated chloride channel family protein
MAIVKFSEQPYWLTPFTHDLPLLDASLEKLSARGETHLYDTTIQMLYELQKQPGRKALVVLTDGVNQGGAFKLDHVVHYARYSGIPVYPIIKNSMLSKVMRIPFVRLDAQKYAEIAKESGATYFIINRTAELPAVYRRISDELRHQYIVSFQTESDGRDLWHPLAIEYSHPDVVLRIPRGYFP